MDIVCDESDPQFWQTVLSVCQRERRAIVRILIARSLKPRRDAIQLFPDMHGRRHGPHGLVVSTENGDDRTCVVTAIFRRDDLLRYAKKRSDKNHP